MFFLYSSILKRLRDSGNQSNETRGLANKIIKKIGLETAPLLQEYGVFWF